MEQEQLIQLQMMQQEAQQLEQQSQIIEQNLNEMNDLKKGLEELETSEEKEILAGLGKGIYIPAEIKDKKLKVEVGKGNFVKKSIPDTKKIIEEQIEKLNQVKIQISERVNQLQEEMGGLIK
tara:strand:+ start:2018 stop:2383 length:366 start_codon:yes stop_codon:yes gene_type:complete